MVHLIKLVVGVTSIEELSRALIPVESGPHAGCCVVYTRQFPKQAQSLCQGGSLFRVINGFILCRQKIVHIIPPDPQRHPPRTRIIIERTIHPVQPRAVRPFQGWRYLQPKDAPPDISPAAAAAGSLPDELRRQLVNFGLLPR